MAFNRYLLLPIIVILSASAALADDPLLLGFENPPASAHPQTWWHWINGNISKRGITADLEAMKRIGLGGAEIFNVDVGIPAGRTPFMSRRWNKDIGFAISEARRLGLELEVHNGAGWSSSGGPWIKPQFAMQELTASETVVHGPSHFEGVLPQPTTNLGTYRDIAVYAIRKPGDDAYRIPDIATLAGFVRGDRLLPSLTGAPPDASIPLNDVQILFSSPDGHLSWDVPPGDWILMRMGYTPTGVENHPAPKSGLGLEVDKLSRRALDTHWAGMVASVLKDAGTVSNPGLDGVLIDSYEVGSQNWSPHFRQEFIKLRGYDPLPYLPVVTGRVVGSLETSERFLWDLRRTICDLFADNYYGYFAQLCHEHGMKFSDEGYGDGSFDDLQVCGAADIPMGEFWVGGGAIDTTKLASSAGHIYGRPIIGAESFTADTAHARWMTDPYALKALGDQVYCLGVNRFIFHSYALQPWLNVGPGMTMGPWGTRFDRTETWWNQAASWVTYLSRCQYLLQAGHFDADVAAYEGEEGPNSLPLMQGNPIPRGYDYDGCDEASLMKMWVDHGQIVLPSGMRYRVLLLPNDTWMTDHVAQKIASLVSAGAIVVGPKPLNSPSLQDAGRGDSNLKLLADTVWGTSNDGSPRRHRFGAGYVYSNVDLQRVLNDIRCSPDVEQVGGGWKLNWIHRTVGNAEIYFVANPEYAPGDFRLSFRVSGKQPELWNPRTGRSEPATLWKSTGRRTIVSLRLESAGSVFVVFRGVPHGDHLVSLNREASPAASTAGAPKVRIISARYEAVDRHGGEDVTDKVRALVAGGDIEIAATNGNFGDPAPEHVKELDIVYTLDGKRMQKVAAENGTIRLFGIGSDVQRPEFAVATGNLYAWSPGTYIAKTAAGRVWRIRAPKATVVSIHGPWSLSFPPHLGAPASATFDRLISWTDSTEAGIKYFSGSATYRKTFYIPSSALKRGFQPFLDLGRVKNIAEVWLNGYKLPTLWKAPFRVRATALLSGNNVLVVRVTNLWPNRLIGDESLPTKLTWNADGSIAKLPDWALNLTPRPPSDRVTFTTWNFFTKNSPLLPSGLLGPVSVVMVPVIPLHK